MSHKTIAMILQAYEGEKAILVGTDGQRLTVGKELLPLGVQIGQSIYLSLQNIPDGPNLKQLAKEAINELLNPKA